MKEDDEYTCPICDYRVKIPRDAARPKLEDLFDWQAEIPDLPFHPEEEAVLDEIISTAQAFRDFMRPYINPVMTNPEEVTTQRFYLRKIEGAEILLGFETNFFRQELHKWAPVAPVPPPVLEQSLSTRKPRPTKQQKLMQQHNVSTPEELPLQFRTKPYNINKARKNSDAHSKNHTLAPARRPRSSHSTSTTNSQDIYTHSHRLPASSSTTSHQQPDSPAFAHSPYFSNGHNPHSPFAESPRYGPRSPLSNSNPSLDPHLFSATDNTYDNVNPNEGLINSPQEQPPYSSGHHSQQRDNVDNIFDEFVTQPEDEVEHHNEIAEAMEDSRREREDEMVRKFLSTNDDDESGV